MKNFADFKGKVVVVIGGSGLIGKAVSSLFEKQGAQVVSASRTLKGGTISGRIIRETVDISNDKSIQNLIAKTCSRFNNIDIWVNCAWPKSKPAYGAIENTDFGALSSDVETHLVGVYRSCALILKQMKKQKSGVIINLGSIYGDLAPDFDIYKNTGVSNSPAYPMIKGGIQAMTKYFACYAAPYNIRVNAVCPGGVFNAHSKLFVKKYSSRVPMKRMADPDEIAGPVVFLASDAASYITGHLLHVDGGLHAW